MIDSCTVTYRNLRPHKFKNKYIHDKQMVIIGVKFVPERQRWEREREGERNSVNVRRVRKCEGESVGTASDTILAMLSEKAVVPLVRIKMFGEEYLESLMRIYELE